MIRMIPATPTKARHAIFNRTRTTCLLFLFLMGLSAGAQAQIYRAAEMTVERYRALDRNKTVVILTSGILEEHGPYMPAYTDGGQMIVLRGIPAAAALKRDEAIEKRQLERLGKIDMKK